MKKYMFILAAFMMLTSVTLTSCDNKKNAAIEAVKEMTEANEELKEIVESSKEQLPISFGNGSTWIDMRLSAKSMTYVYNVNSSYRMPTRIEIKGMLRNGTMNKDFAHLCHLLVTTNRSLVYHYDGYQSADIVIKSSELEEILNE